MPPGLSLRKVGHCLMKTRILHTKLWSDSYFAELGRHEKLLFLYLITNEKINMVGCYELSDREISFWTGLTAVEISEAKEKFQKDGKFFFIDNWVKVVNHDKYNNYGNGSKQEVSYRKELALIPSEVLESFMTMQSEKEGDSDTSMVLVSGAYRYPSDTNHKPKIENNKTKNKKRKIEDNLLEFDETVEQVGLEALLEKHTHLSKKKIEDALANMRDWLVNTTVSKGHKRDYLAFINTWLRREDGDKKGGVSRGRYESDNKPASGKYEAVKPRKAKG